MLMKCLKISNTEKKTKQGYETASNSNTQVGRDIPRSANQNDFWILHALGAYNPAKSEDFDHAIPWRPGVPLAPGTMRWQPGYARPVSALIYNEVIRDVINTSRWVGPRPDWIDVNGRPPWVTPAVARAILVLHEVLHYFLGPHISPCVVDQKTHRLHPSDRGIMDVNWNSSSCYLYTTGIQELDPDQIQRIQERPYPDRV